MLFIHKETGEIWELLVANYLNGFCMVRAYRYDDSLTLRHLRKDFEFLGWL